MPDTDKTPFEKFKDIAGKMFPPMKPVEEKERPVSDTDRAEKEQGL